MNGSTCLSCKPIVVGALLLSLLLSWVSIAKSRGRAYSACLLKREWPSSSLLLRLLMIARSKVRFNGAARRLASNSRQACNAFEQGIDYRS